LVGPPTWGWSRVCLEKLAYYKLLTHEIMGADMDIIDMVLTRICWQSVVKTETNL